MPYLVLDDGAIYGRFKLGFGSMLTPKFEEPSRAKMETDIADAKTDNATKNAALIATMEKADRQKGVWFAGSAEGTLIGDQVHEMFGTMDLEGGLEIDATVEMANGSITKKVMDSVEQARDAGGMLGSEIKQVIDAIEVKRDGDRVRFSLKVSNAQLDKVFDKLSPMMGGSMGKRRQLDDLE
jgi:preprotein translocase subunit SecD